MGGGAKVMVEGHRHEGVFIARGKEDALVTKNMVSGESVYGEKRISVEVSSGFFYNNMRSCYHDLRAWYVRSRKAFHYSLM